MSAVNENRRICHNGDTPIRLCVSAGLEFKTNTEYDIVVIFLYGCIVRSGTGIFIRSEGVE